MYTRCDVEFATDDGIKLRGWFYKVASSHAKPCIIMTHGFSALKEHYLDKFAEQFAGQGFNTLVYDNRNFGASDCQTPLEVDPIAQIRDLKNAISYVQRQPNIDSQHIGLWGTSFSAGTATVVAAVDKRVKAVVLQVPFVSGHHKSLRTTKPDAWNKMRSLYHDDRDKRLAGEAPATIKVVPDKEGEKAIMRIPSSIDFFKSVPSWINQVTLRSVENSGEFEPIAYIKQISPTPLLYIVAKHDTVNTTDLALKAFKKAREPKKLVMIPGDHFAPYVDEFNVCCKSALNWFKEHLENELDSRNTMKSKL